MTQVRIREEPPDDGPFDQAPGVDLAARSWIGGDRRRRSNL
jgi:hypothetical protein